MKINTSKSKIGGGTGTPSLRVMSLPKFCSGVLLSLLLVACQQSSRTGKEVGVHREESLLTLNNATLEQSNAKGQTVWKIQVGEAAYSPDRQKAQLSKVRGNLFQDGKLVLQVSAERGEIVREGEDIALKDNIIAKDPRNGIVIRTDAIHWQPKQDLVAIDGGFKGSHPKLEATANQARYYTRKQRLELEGKILAETKNPRLQIKTDKLWWDIPQDKVSGDRRLEIVRYQDKTVTDRLLTNRSEVNLKANTVLIRENIEFKSLDPPIQVTSNSVLWNYKDRTLRADQPIQLFHYRDGITITGNSALVDLKQKFAQLKGGVQGSSRRSQATLYANELTWNIPTQVVEAGGNVTYEQVKPKFHLRGEQAIGRLQDNSVVVRSNGRERVVTEIVPE